MKIRPRVEIWGGVALFALFLPVAAYAHAFYMSTCLIRHLPEERRIEVELRIFPDDLELALKNFGAPPLGLMGIKDGLPDRPYQSSKDGLAGRPSKGKYRILPDTTAGKWIYPYLRTTFSLSVNGKLVPLWLDSWEKYEDVIKVVLAQEDICDIHSVKVRNEILTEIYDGQANIVKVKVAGNSETMNLNKIVKVGTVEF